MLGFATAYSGQEEAKREEQNHHKAGSIVHLLGGGCS